MNRAELLAMLVSTILVIAGRLLVPGHGLSAGGTVLAFAWIAAGLSLALSADLMRRGLPLDRRLDNDCWSILMFAVAAALQASNSCSGLQQGGAWPAAFEAAAHVWVGFMGGHVVARWNTYSALVASLCLFHASAFELYMALKFLGDAP